MRKLLSILTLLFFSATLFAQVKLKPVTVIVEQHNGNSGDFYLVLNSKQVSRTFHLYDEILNVKHASLHLWNEVYKFTHNTQSMQRY